MSVLINMLRRIVDKHDEKHSLRKKYLSVQTWEDVTKEEERRFESL